MDMTDFRIGDKVRCEREEPPKGTWKLYDGREGTVVSINQTDGEIGIAWSPGEDLAKTPTDASFLPSELVKCIV